MKLLQKVGSKIWKDVSITVKGKKLPRYILLRDMRVLAGHVHQSYDFDDSYR
jgi:hypothetical protein